MAGSLATKAAVEDALRCQRDFDLAAGQNPAPEHDHTVSPTTFCDRERAHDEMRNKDDSTDVWWLGRRHAVVKDRLYFAVYRDASQMQRDADRNPTTVYLFSAEQHTYKPYCEDPFPDAAAPSLSTLAPSPTSPPLAVGDSPTLFCRRGFWSR
jgi:hypothetical protein